LLVSIGSNTPAAEKILIGISQATMNSAWRLAMVEGNKKYPAEHYPDNIHAFQVFNQIFHAPGAEGLGRVDDRPLLLAECFPFLWR
jgi:hypothetical protein